MFRCINSHFLEQREQSDACISYAESRQNCYEVKFSILNFSSDGVTSWYDFAKMIAKMAGHTACDIQPCHSDEYPSPVKRPAYSVLDKTKIKETFGVSVPYWTDSLKVCIDNLLNNPFRVER